MPVLNILKYPDPILRQKAKKVKEIDKSLEILTSELWPRKGLEAIALQHEIDHLDGILFIDRAVSLKTDLFSRKGRKA